MTRPLLLPTLSALLCVLLVSCDAPGEGGRADHAKRIGDEIVADLAAYNSVHQRFPRSLTEVGVNLDDNEVNGPEGRVKIFYRSSSAEQYELTVKYFGPGSNSCTHRSDMGYGEWECSGAY
jgi:hypothetical protein